MTVEIVLFAVGSPLVVEYEESCRRLGIAIVAGVRNRDGEAYVSDRVKVLRPETLGRDITRVPCLCPLFTPANRRTAVGEARAAGFSVAPALVDPTSIVAGSTAIGEGGYVNAGCVIGAAGEIGAQAVINRGASLGHHARLEDYVSIGPSAVLAGGVRVGEGAVIGAGAVILPGVRIGRSAVIGAGAVVTHDVADGQVMAGNPAKPVPRNETGSVR